MPPHESPLRRLRQERKLSREVLAVRAGVSVATIHRAEHGLHRTTDATWEALAEALEVSVDALKGQPDVIHDDSDGGTGAEPAEPPSVEAGAR